VTRRGYAQSASLDFKANGGPSAFRSQRHTRHIRTLIASGLWKGVEVWHARMLFPG
jgi:hypothetical protein